MQVEGNKYYYRHMNFYEELRVKRMVRYRFEKNGVKRLLTIVLKDSVNMTSTEYVSFNIIVSDVSMAAPLMSDVIVNDVPNVPIKDVTEEVLEKPKTLELCNNRLGPFDKIVNLTKDKGVVMRHVKGVIRAMAIRRKDKSLLSPFDYDRFLIDEEQYDISVPYSAVNSLINTIINTKIVTVDNILDLYKVATIKLYGAPAMIALMPVVETALQIALQVQSYALLLSSSKLVRAINDVKGGNIETKARGIINRFKTWIGSAVYNAPSLTLNEATEMADLGIMARLFCEDDRL